MHRRAESGGEESHAVPHLGRAVTYNVVRGPNAFVYISLLGEQLKLELLEHHELRRWLGSLWVDTKVGVRSQAAEPDSELRARLTDAIVAAGQRMERDPVVGSKVDDVVEWGTRYVGENFHAEIAGLVSGTLARWDAEETSRKLELASPRARPAVHPYQRNRRRRPCGPRHPLRR
jgi:hypothetical protein